MILQGVPDPVTRDYKVSVGRSKEMLFDVGFRDNSVSLEGMVAESASHSERASHSVLDDYTAVAADPLDFGLISGSMVVAEPLCRARAAYKYSPSVTEVRHIEHAAACLHADKGHAGRGAGLIRVNQPQLAVDLSLIILNGYYSEKDLLYRET